MRNPLSIFNSENRNSRKSLWYNGFIWAVLIIICIEIFMAIKLPSRFYSHEVDHALYRVAHLESDPRILFIGDSIAYGVFKNFHSEPDRYANFATNWGITMAGHYYIVKRHFSRGRATPCGHFYGNEPFQPEPRSHAD